MTAVVVLALALDPVGAAIEALRAASSNLNARQ
jgi:hypothetical protein